MDATNGVHVVSATNGTKAGAQPYMNRADEVSDPLSLVEYHPPKRLVQLLDFQLPSEGKGKDGLLDILERILLYSVNTWDQGFMHKLYASTNAVGVVSELILAVLNTNVSPALTVIEKATTRAFASLFGLAGPHAGGVTQPGGSASNATALVIACNVLFPGTKSEGVSGKRFVMFTSAHGHYSHEKAAQICGIGGSNAWPVPVDSQGRMRVAELDRLINKARTEGPTPFYVNATAGTTVLGAYGLLQEIAELCRRENLWFHIDASWGGSIVFSEKHRHKMRGPEHADSPTASPHKMPGVPVTCSFLLTADPRRFWRANTLPAAYLFHGDPDEEPGGCGKADRRENGAASGDQEVWDLADLTLQGRLPQARPRVDLPRPLRPRRQNRHRLRHGLPPRVPGPPPRERKPAAVPPGVLLPRPRRGPGGFGAEREAD
ncbi:hypothetical protein FGG08_005302 [Glutinoglossum americanum]|uniref:Glutamate decarboxylase n=1 Tax=Glutinoglossum americanum TaxID=1670608 RepID=A0A9P8I9Q2_9PEZI|nr:hypothetical protein FGG08_005302 [Glutinoglossum americanum]